MNNTLRFEIVTGISGGYENLNSCQKDEVNIVSKLWQKNAKAEYERSNIYVTAVIKRSYTVYHEDWGCPEGGERTVVITGVCNDEFVKDKDQWKDIVLKLAEKLKEQLKQETMTCEFMESELHYLK